jgi:hypothetical protein
MSIVDDVTLISVVDLGNDVLEVKGTIDPDPLEITTSGWVSATTNVFDPGDYDENGNLKWGSQPHAMTEEEKDTYYKTLILNDIHRS